MQAVELPYNDSLGSLVIFICSAGNRRFFLPKVEIKFLHGTRVDLHGMALIVCIISLNRFV